MYQIEKTKEITDCENIVAVMSGNFVQRGSAAICDKWARAEMAVKNGVNLVIELPSAYSCQTAEIFAKGAIEILNALNIVDGISFGVENDNKEEIIKTATVLNNETSEFKEELNKQLSLGIGYPKARQTALKAVYGIDLTDSPNNILAVEYVRQLQKLGSNIDIVPIKRKGSFHDKEGSASYIRELIKEGRDFSDFVPENVAEIVKRETDNGTMPVLDSAFSQALLYKLRTVSPKELKNIADMAEGLENRIIAEGAKQSDIETLVSAVSTKRYSNARIRRILQNVLLGITKEETAKSPSYIKVLGADKKGFAMLKEIKDKCSLPIIVKTADGKDLPELQKEIQRSSVYSLGYKNKDVSLSSQEYTMGPYILK